MMSRLSWLPELIYEHQFRGDKDKFISAVYELFKQDFIDNKPEFRGQKLGLKRHPLKDGREATFYHMTTEGHDENNRQICNERCERIKWPKPVIECEELCFSNDVKIWKNKRSGETRINLFVESANYFVVLAERKGYLLPWTAFCIKHTHEKRKKLNDFKRYQKRPW